MVDRAELRNVNENVASLFNTGPRNQALMKGVFGTTEPIANLPAVPSSPVRALIPLAERVRSDAEKPVVYNLKLPGSALAPSVTAKGVDDITLKSLLFSILNRFDLKDLGTSLKINLTRTGTAQDPRVIVSTTPALSAESSKELATALQGNSVFVEYLQKLIGPTSRSNSLEASLVINPGRGMSRRLGAMDLSFNQVSQPQSKVEFLRGRDVKVALAETQSAPDLRPQSPGRGFIRRTTDTPDGTPNSPTFFDALLAAVSGPRVRVTDYSSLRELLGRSPRVFF